MSDVSLVQCRVYDFPECNGKTYSKDTHLCCGGKLYPIEPYTMCCSGEMIDTRTSACFLGKALHNLLNGKYST